MSQTQIGDLTALHAPAQGSSRRGSIVFLHGLWAASWIFEDWLAPAAARGWDAWAPNLRGREGSRPVHDVGRIGLADFAEDLRAVLGVVGDCVVVGYSTGGLVTQMVMADAAWRDRIRTAVLLCTVPPRGVLAVSGPTLKSSWRYLPAMAMSRPMAPSRADAEALLMNDLPAEERERWFPRFFPDSGRASRQIALGAVRVDPARVTCPVLVVSAEDDRISPPSIQPALVRRYGAEHLAIKRRGHTIAIEPGWDAVEGLILDWVEAIAQGS